MCCRTMGNSEKALIISSPSGAGKSTIIGRLKEALPQLRFSISATSRKPRPGEQDGREYYFLSSEEFRRRIEADAFIEWNEVYQGTYYGTLRTELVRCWEAGHVALFDVDVEGAARLKEALGDNALSLFILPPSLEVLRARLVARGTETAAEVAKRLARAEKELKASSTFDAQVVNDDLDQAVATALGFVRQFLHC